MKNWHLTIAHWMPRWLVYACYIRLVADVTTKPPYDTKTPDEVSVMDALGEWT